VSVERPAGDGHFKTLAIKHIQNMNLCQKSSPINQLIEVKLPLAANAGES